MAGLGSPHCAGMCGGFASVCASTWRSAAAWHAGRLTTYATLGALAGAFGRMLPGPPWIPFALSAVLLCWFALVLAGAAPYLRPVPGLQQIGARLLGRTDTPSRYLFGITTGMLPCGLVYAALGFAIAAESAWVGALTMLAFGLATVPVLAVLGGAVSRIAARGIWHRRVLALVILVTALWSLQARYHGH
jgi:sulfite exporter TauE/SafE